MSKCEFIGSCPAATERCNDMQPDKNCLSMVIQNYERLKEQNGIIIVRSKILVKKEELEKARAVILEQASGGCVVLPACFEAQYIPPNVAITFEG